MNVSTSLQITDAQRRQYREEGYFVLEGVLTLDWLDALRAEADKLVQPIHDEMLREGVEIKGRNQLNKRYFVGRPYLKNEVFKRFITSEYFAEICRATIGDEAYLFSNQLAVKGTEPGGAFSWHQDSGYLGYAHKPYVTTWTCFDDVDETNGTVYLLPWSRYPESREVIPHVKDEKINDKVGYFGDDPGVPVVVPAGSIAVFSSLVFHRSGPNQTDRQRRALVSQYSPEVLMNEAGTGPQNLDVPLLKAGRKVVDDA